MAPGAREQNGGGHEGEAMAASTRRVPGGGVQCGLQRSIGRRRGGQEF